MAGARAVRVALARHRRIDSNKASVDCMESATNGKKLGPLGCQPFIRRYSMWRLQGRSKGDCLQSVGCLDGATHEYQTRCASAAQVLVRNTVLRLDLMAPAGW